MISAISQVCCLSSPFENDVEQFGAAGCRAVEIWLTKLEDYVREHSAEQAKALLQEHQLRPVAASYLGGMLSSQGAPRAAAWELFDKRLQLCRDVGVDVLVLACDVSEPLSETLIDRVRASLTQAAQAAAPHGMRLALEFQARATLGNNLQTAAMLVGEAGQDNLGLCLDVFHFFCGPSKFPDLGYLTQKNLFHVQMSDTLGVPREMASDSQRIVPGDGELLLQPVIDRLREIGYAGALSVEMMNPLIWQSPPRQTAEIALAGLERLLAVRN